MYYRSGCSLLAFLLGVAVAISTVTAETDVSSSELVDSTEGEHRGLRGSFGWSPRIINGDIVTDPSKYPYFALMRINGNMACGGALIGPKFVLTAAHCVSPDATDTFDIGVIRAGGVSSSLSSFSKPSGTSYGVKERKMHPGYDENTVINDIAVYELDRPVTGVQYIKLGKTPVSEDGKDLTVIGMGATQSGGPGSDRLRKTTVDYMPNSVCTDKMPLFSSYNANDGDLCAYRKNTDSCQGDSGGPLLIETGSASTHELVGVVSWGYGCAEATPGVYARVSYYYDWIVETMCSMNAKAVPTEYSCSVGPSAPPIDNDDTSGIGTIEPTTFSSFEGFEDEDSEFYTSIWEEIARWFGF